MSLAMILTDLLDWVSTLTTGPWYQYETPVKAVVVRSVSSTVSLG